MIAVLFPAAWAADVTVTSTADSGPGSLRQAIGVVAPGDRIVFSTSTFPPGMLTPIVVGPTALPTLDTDDVTIEGDGRVQVSCGPAMSTGDGLVIHADDVVVRGLALQGCPGSGVVITGIFVELDDDVITGHDAFGVLVDGTALNTLVPWIHDSDIGDNCASTVSTCAGIGVRRTSSASGQGPYGTSIHANRVWGSGSGGHGIGVVGGQATVVMDNEVGDNDGYGIALARIGTAPVGLSQISSNVVGRNGQAGILLGVGIDPAEVTDNLVGIDAASSDQGNLGVGIEVFASDDHLLLDNVVSGNDAGGILVHGALSGSPSERIRIERNLVGTRTGGGNPVPNIGFGVRLVAAGAPSTGHVLVDNVISGNDGAGVIVEASGVTLIGNAIGAGRSRASGVPNTGDGVVVEALGFQALGASEDGRWTPNVVSGNQGSGFVLRGAGPLIQGNLIGMKGNRVGHIGNGGDGIRVERGALATLDDNVVGFSGGDGIALTGTVGTTTSAVVSDNEVRDNGGVGIRASGSTVTAQWSRNRIRDNGLCAIRTENGANGGTIAAPELVENTRVRARGTFAVPGGAQLARIEVFADDADEAGRFVGQATVAGSTWSIDLDDTDPLLPVDGGRVSAVMLLTDGRSSDLAPSCQDGCTGIVPGTCNSGSPCVAGTCTAGGCVFGPTNDGAVCDDGNDCVDGSTCGGGSCLSGAVLVAGRTCNDGNACTEYSTCQPDGSCIEQRPEGVKHYKCPDDGDSCTGREACDAELGCVPVLREEGFHCEDGDACTVGEETCDLYGNCIAEQVALDCPQQTACNVCECDPTHGCVCEGICGDGICGPDDLFPYCLEDCGLDSDADGFPDIWEANGADLDCDGVVDVLAQDFSLGRDVFVETDYMVDIDHSHEPTEDNLDKARSAFLQAGVNYVHDLDEAIPHADRIEFDVSGGPSAPDDPGAPPDWVSFSSIRREHFSNTRRGVYRYGVWAHTFNNAGNTGISGAGANFAITRGNGAQGASGEIGVFMHELGHTLGLGHGGIDTQQQKTNYLSSMSYRWTLRGMILADDPDGETWPDYSHDSLLDLDESFLFEPLGVAPTVFDPDFNYLLEYECGDTRVLVDPLVGTTGVSAGVGNPWPTPSIDWNCNGFIDQVWVQADVNGDGEIASSPGHDDWANLNMVFQAKPSFHQEHGPVDEGDLSECGPEDVPTLADLAAAGLANPVRLPRVDAYPGCVSPTIPRSGPYVVPVVVYGSADLDPTPAVDARLTTAVASAGGVDDVDGDGFDDLWFEIDVADLTLLHPDALVVHLWARLPDGTDLAASVPITRVDSPPDTDGDGIHDACDACPTIGAPRGPDGCPP